MAMSDSLAPRANDSDGLLDQIDRGDSVQQQAAIDELLALAERSNDPANWNTAALGLHRLRRFDEEIDILMQLVNNVPSNDVYRLNLATAYSQVESIDLCRFHLRTLIEQASTEEMRRIGEEQLRGYESFLGLGESDTQLRNHQVDYIEERIAIDPGAPQNYIALSRLLERIGKLEPGGDLFERAAEVLEQGLAACTDCQELLENLSFCYLHADPKNRMNTVVDELEAIAPNSRILESLANVFREGGGPGSQTLSARVRMLMQEVGQKDEALSEAALRDLARIVDTNSDTTSYRLSFAFCLGMTGRTEAAKRQAERLEQVQNCEHGHHFNLGQIFWWCGDPDRGRHHLQLALRYATSEEEKKDVHDRIAELEAAA
jgi:tetratricopeptide (TPR) repeat protein